MLRRINGWHPFSLSLRVWVCHPITRTYVRLLGPCFKTGRLGAFGQASLTRLAATRLWDLPVRKHSKKLSLPQNKSQSPAKRTLPFFFLKKKALVISPPEGASVERTASVMGYNTLVRKNCFSPIFVTFPITILPPLPLMLTHPTAEMLRPWHHEFIERWPQRTTQKPNKPQKKTSRKPDESTEGRYCHQPLPF